jgi:phenylpropionate dioxygenase-like ring-hydroxylating dioxygenase large terminal subunit
VGVTRAWYVACPSGDLGRAPLARTVLGQPVVLFRDGEGRAAALLDRCAHRNTPLSLGRVVEGRLECGYHGWQYDAAGACVRVPGRCGGARDVAACVPRFPALEEDGFVWIWAAPDAPPEGAPFRLPAVDPETYTTVRRVVEMEGPLPAVLENALDVPHTAFLHRGLFRGAGAPHRVKALVTRSPSGVQAEYVGEPRPEGWAGKILSPSGGTVSHVDRFFLPSVAQVEYRLGTEVHLLTTALCTPVDDARTRIHAVIGFRTRLPGWLVRMVLERVAMRIFRQDAFIVKAQADAVRRFGSERYASTELDLLGAQIARLLRRAEKGIPREEDPADPDTGWTREVEMEV